MGGIPPLWRVLRRLGLGYSSLGGNCAAVCVGYSTLGGNRRRGDCSGGACRKCREFGIVMRRARVGGRKKLTIYARPQLTGLGQGQLSQEPAGQGQTWEVMIHACQNTWDNKNPVRSDNAHCKT